MRRPSRTTLSCAAVVLACVTFGAIALYYPPFQDYTSNLFEWLETLGWWGPVAFIAVYSAIVVLILPGAPLTIGAGFLFGITLGAICCVLGNTVGALFSFLIARHLLGERLARWVLSNRKFAIITDGLRSEGGRFILLSRMIPFFPAKLANYYFGLSRFRIRDLVFGTLIGTIPNSIVMVYIGSAASSIAAIGTARNERTTLEWIFYGAGFIVAVATAIYTTRVARRALAKHSDEYDKNPENHESSD